MRARHAYVETVRRIGRDFERLARLLKNSIVASDRDLFPGVPFYGPQGAHSLIFLIA
jgi:hypothetical protein